MPNQKFVFQLKAPYKELNVKMADMCVRVEYGEQKQLACCLLVEASGLWGMK